MSRILCALVALLGLAAVARAEEEGGQGKEPWASFKVGSWVKTRKSILTNLGGTGMERVHERLTTIKSITDDEVVLTIDEEDFIVAGNQRQKEGENHSESRIARKKKVDPAQDKPKDKPKAKPKDEAAAKEETGEEEIEVAGKKLKCRWKKTTRSSGGAQMSLKTWMNDDIPGLVAKIEKVEDQAGLMGPTKVSETTIVAGYEAK